MKRDKLNLSYALFFIGFFAFSSLSSNDQPTAEDIRNLEELKQGQTLVKEDEKFLEIQTSTIRDEDECEDCIYGYNFFQNTPTTFALSSNVPIPSEYKLGPGDKIKVEYFGSNNDETEGYITRSGFLKLPLLGPISIAGLELYKAEELIRKKVSEELIGTEVFISLSELRSINVYLVGAAFKPGTYTVSAMSSLANVIFATGGPDKVGSLRNIQVKRNGLLVSSFDFYKLLLEGDTSQDTRLQDGDTIYFPLIKRTARVSGSVQRPGKYEILEGETLADLYEFSGLTSNDNLKVEFSRYDTSVSSRIVKIFSEVKDSEEIQLIEGDSANVLSNSNKLVANVLLSGEFVYPGYYDISAGENISEVIERAGGFNGFAYPEAAIFTRESVRLQQKESYLKTAQELEKSLINVASLGQLDGETYAALTEFIDKLKQQQPIGRQVAKIDDYSLRSDPSLDFSLQDGDTIFVPKRSSSISVVGEVLNSTTHLYNPDLSIQDYLNLSGGVTDGADKSKIFVILPNGQSLIYKRKLFQNDLETNLLPGSTIVVSRNPDPYNWTKLASVISPILSDLAVSAAALSAIGNNN